MDIKDQSVDSLNLHSELNGICVDQTPLSLLDSSKGLPHPEKCLLCKQEQKTHAKLAEHLFLRQTGLVFLCYGFQVLALTLEDDVPSAWWVNPGANII